jgi:hypothetical protein
VIIKINQQKGVAEIGSKSLDACSMRQYKEQPLQKHMSYSALFRGMTTVNIRL